MSLGTKSVLNGFSTWTFHYNLNSLQESSRTQCGILCEIFKLAEIQAGFSAGKLNGAEKFQLKN